LAGAISSHPNKDINMNKLTVSISSDILTMFPAITIAGCRVLIPEGSNLGSIISDLSDRAKTIASEIDSVDPITSLPQIACWRDAYGRIGVKPSKFHSSIEALLRRLKKGQDITTGLPIVDFYNLISLTEMAPIGAYDATKFTSPEITMRCANPEFDRFDPLGGQTDAFPLNPSLAVYASGTDILCWGFNTRDSKMVCVDDSTREVLFFSEMTDEVLGGSPFSTIKALSDRLAGVGLATKATVILSRSNSTAEL
jgi:DNA/RNA-binding domain of Phe-tRNA-synthetase-like protein